MAVGQVTTKLGDAGPVGVVMGWVGGWGWGATESREFMGRHREQGRKGAERDSRELEDRERTPSPPSSPTCAAPTHAVGGRCQAWQCTTARLPASKPNMQFPCNPRPP